MNSHRKKILIQVLVSLLGLAALYGLLHDVDWAQVGATSAQTPLWVWLVSTAGLLLSHVFRAGRIRSEWSHRSGDMHLTISWLAAWALSVRHTAWVVLTPMRGGEAIYVWALHRQGGIPIKEATYSLIKLRLQDMAVLGVITVALIPPWPWPTRLALAALAAMAAIWLAPVIWRWLVSRAKKLEAPYSIGVPAPTLSGWLYSSANWCVKLLSIGLLLGTWLNLHEMGCIQAALGGEIAAALPAQPPAGLGPYEAGVWAAVNSIAPNLAQQAAAAALIAHLLTLAVTVGSATLARVMGWSNGSFRPPNANASQRSTSPTIP